MMILRLMMKEHFIDHYISTRKKYMMKKEKWIMNILQTETNTGKKEIKGNGNMLQIFMMMTAKLFFDINEGFYILF